MPSEPAMCFEDVAVGDRFRSEELVITAAEIVEYARSFDPQPMHTSPDAAGALPFGGLVASGWHTLSLTMRLMVEARPFGSTPLIGMAVDEVRFARPVPPGTRLLAEALVTGVRASARRPDRGYVTMSVRTVDQGGAEFASQVWTLVLPARGAAGAWRV